MASLIFTHFEFHGLTHELVVIGNRLHVDLRSRQEGFHTEYVNDQPPFGFAGNQAGNDFAGFIDFDDFFFPGAGRCVQICG